MISFIPQSVSERVLPFFHSSFPLRLLIKLRSCIKKLPQRILKMTVLHLFGTNPYKVLQLIHIFLLCNRSLCYIGKSLLPAGSQFRVQKLTDRTVYHIINHFPLKGRCDHLGFLIQRQISDIKQLLQNLCSGGAGTNSASLDL